MLNIPNEELIELTLEAQNNYQPRSSFYDRQIVDVEKDKSFNILAYSGIPTIKKIHDVKALSPRYLGDVLALLDQLYSTVERTPDSKCFLTFSAPFGYQNCPSHVHHMIDGNPCMTTTFAIPLSQDGELPSMMITRDSVKRPSRWYLDPSRIPSGLDYQELKLYPDGITKFEFNSSFRPHFITYNQSVVLWFVIDGSIHDHDLLVTEY
jgi:hypothetical protein